MGTTQQVPAHEGLVRLREGVIAEAMLALAMGPEQQLEVLLRLSGEGNLTTRLVEALNGVGEEDLAWVALVAEEELGFLGEVVRAEVEVRSSRRAEDKRRLTRAVEWRDTAVSLLLGTYPGIELDAPWLGDEAPTEAAAAEAIAALRFSIVGVKEVVTAMWYGTMSDQGRYPRLCEVQSAEELKTEFVAAIDATGFKFSRAGLSALRRLAEVVAEPVREFAAGRYFAACEFERGASSGSNWRQAADTRFTANLFIDPPVELWLPQSEAKQAFARQVLRVAELCGSRPQLQG